MTTRRDGPVGILFLAALVLGAGCSGTPATKPVKDGSASGSKLAEEALDSARQMLAGIPDRSDVSVAMQQVNAYLAHHPEHQSAPLPAEQRAQLEKQFRLDPGEVEEVASATCTLLDAQHVNMCLLFRDAVRGLGGEKTTPAEQAAAAFAWVVRQVVVRDQVGEPAPPEFVLRRGAGTSLERALVFLAALHQLGIPGCLLTVPGVDEPWACGALVPVQGQGHQVLLFEHRLGLPIPGPPGAPDAELARAFRRALPVPGPRRDGQTIATLSALRRQPGLLAELARDEKHGYAIKPEMVRQTEVELAVPLSALAPRMRTLQDDLLPPAVTVRLAVEPQQQLQQFTATEGIKESGGTVRIRQGSAGLLRRFLPEEEGGMDRDHRKDRFQLALAPFQVMPPQIQELQGKLRERIWSYFGASFVSQRLDPRLPRDLVLRGRFKEAAALLVKHLTEVRNLKAQLQATPDLPEQYARWKAAMYSAYGDLERAQSEARRSGSPLAVETARSRIEQVWRENLSTLTLMVSVGAVDFREALLTYWQAQCLHEQAERADLRAEQLARAGPELKLEQKSARQAARMAWKECAGWWENVNGALLPESAGGAVLLWQARTQEAQDQIARARQLLENLEGTLTERDRTTRLFLARRLQ
jgi:hypothetical protein